MTIHPTAQIAPGARLGRDVTIGAYTLVEDAVELGDGCVVGSHCLLGVEPPGADGGPLVLGAGSLVRSHGVLYAGARLGPGLRTGHGVTVREGVEAGEGLMLGTGCDLQGHQRIGRHVRMHSHCQVNHKAEIGDFVWLFPHVVLANDPQPPSETILPVWVDDFAALGARATVLPGVRVGRDALVAAGTLVRHDVPEGMLCRGAPGRMVGPASGIRLKADGLPAYPWRRHFHRGYPADVVARWRQEFARG